MSKVIDIQEGDLIHWDWRSNWFQRLTMRPAIYDSIVRHVIYDKHNVPIKFTFCFGFEIKHMNVNSSRYVNISAQKRARERSEK